MDCLVDKELAGQGHEEGRVNGVTIGTNDKCCPSGTHTASGAIQKFQNAMDSGTECAHSHSAADTKLSDAVKTLGAWDGIQRDRHKLKKVAHGNLIWFNKTKWEVLHMDKDNPTINTGWGMNRLRAALWRRTWGCWLMKGWTRASSVCLQPEK